MGLFKLKKISVILLLCMMCSCTVQNNEIDNTSETTISEPVITTTVATTTTTIVDEPLINIKDCAFSDIPIFEDSIVNGQFKTKTDGYPRIIVKDAHCNVGSRSPFTPESWYDCEELKNTIYNTFGNYKKHLPSSEKTDVEIRNEETLRNGTVLESTLLVADLKEVLYSGSAIEIPTAFQVLEDPWDISGGTRKAEISFSADNLDYIISLYEDGYFLEISEGVNRLSYTYFSNQYDLTLLYKIATGEMIHPNERSTIQIPKNSFTSISYLDTDLFKPFIENGEFTSKGEDNLIYVLRSYCEEGHSYELEMMPGGRVGCTLLNETATNEMIDVTPYLHMDEHGTYEYRYRVMEWTEASLNAYKTIMSTFVGIVQFPTYFDYYILDNMMLIRRPLIYVVGTNENGQEEYISYDLNPISENEYILTVSSSNEDVIARFYGKRDNVEEYYERLLEELGSK